MNISSFLFLDNIEEPTISNEFSIGSNGLTLALEVSGDFTDMNFMLEGKVDRDSTQWTILSFTEVSTLGTMTECGEAGVYKINVAGLCAVRINLLAIDTGAVRVQGKLVDSRFFPMPNPNTQSVDKWISFYIDGELTVGTNLMNIIAPVNMTIYEIRLAIDVAPTGSDLILDFNTSELVDGVFNAPVTMFTTQASRPKLAVGKSGNFSALPDVGIIPQGSKISLDIDQVGSEIAGENLSVMIVCGV